MKLRSPEAFWLLKNGLMNSYPSLATDEECDTLVIGGGITGALISHALVKAGYNTIVLDKRDIATGSTSATTSMLQYEIDTPITELAEMIGDEGAVLCYEKGITAINTLQALIRDEGIDCGYESKYSLQVAHSKEAVRKLREEYQYRKSHGFDVEWLESAEIQQRYGMKSLPGILSTTGGSVDAYELAHGLLQNNMKRGIRVYDHTEIKDVEYTDTVLVTTVSGYSVKCKKVIYCTGYETLTLFKKEYAELVSTFACVSEQGFNLYPQLKDILIWDTADPYIYMRTTDDGRLLLGGEDVRYSNPYVRDAVKLSKTKKLLKKLDKLFPTLHFTLDFNWAGAFGVTKDGLPFLGEHPDFPNTIFAMGLGGNGITFSVQGMDLVLKILEGSDDPLLHYYRFDR